VEQLGFMVGVWRDYQSCHEGFGNWILPRRSRDAAREEKDEVYLRPLLLCLSADNERGDQATNPDKAMATQHGCFFTHSLNHFFPRRSAFPRVTGVS
jgi:hypothetical protein